MSRGYNLLVLAGGEKGPLSQVGDYSSKAMIPLHNKPMIDWVLDAYKPLDYFDHTVVVGPEELNSCKSMEGEKIRLNGGGTLIQNLLLGIGYIKTHIYQCSSHHKGYVISFCDAVFLTPELIEHTMKNIESSGADIVLHYVEKESFVRDNLPSKRTYIPMEGKLYTGSVIYYVRKFSMVMGLLKKLSQFRKHRKDPGKLLEIIGAESDSLEDIEEALSTSINGKVKIFISPFSGMGMDVDKPSDLELAHRLLS